MKLFSYRALPFSLALCFSVTLAAEQQWQQSANLALVSDYQFRGISQTDEGAAIQGGFDMNHQQGWYLGLWGSNIEFGEGSMELDLYAGWSGKWESGVQTDVGLIHYAYPQGDSNGADLSYSEVYGSLGYQGWTVGAAYSPDYFGAGVEDYQYLYVSYDLPLTDRLGLTLNLGHNQFDNASEMALFLGSAEPSHNDSYLDWQLALTADVADYGSIGLAYVDTNLDQGQCLDICDKRWILSMTRSF